MEMAQSRVYSIHVAHILSMLLIKYFKAFRSHVKVQNLQTVKMYLAPLRGLWYKAQQRILRTITINNTNKSFIQHLSHSPIPERTLVQCSHSATRIITTTTTATNNNEAMIVQQHQRQ